MTTISAFTGTKISVNASDSYITCYKYGRIVVCEVNLTLTGKLDTEEDICKFPYDLYMTWTIASCEGFDGYCASLLITDTSPSTLRCFLYDKDFNKKHVRGTLISVVKK